MLDVVATKTTQDRQQAFFRVFSKNATLCLSLFIYFAGAVLLPTNGWSAPEQESERSTFLENLEKHRRDIAKRMEMATIWVITESEDGSEGMGSGFIVGDGYVLTNAHVASKDDSAYVFVMNESLPPTEAQVIASTPLDSRPDADFSLLRFVVPTGVSLPVLSFNTEVQRMDRVSAWGYPYMVLQFDKSLDEDNEDLSMPPVVYTEGTVNAIVQNSRPTIIHSAAIAAGNSGGPLINRNGEVLGINTWGSTEEDEGAFINASLPASSILPFLRANGVSPIVVGLENPDERTLLATESKMSGQISPDALQISAIAQIVTDVAFGLSKLDKEPETVHVIRNITKQTQKELE